MPQIPPHTFGQEAITLQRGFLYQTMRNHFPNATDKQFDAYYQDATASRRQLTKGLASSGIKYAFLGFMVSLFTGGRIPFTSIQPGKTGLAMLAALVGVWKNLMGNILETQKQLVGKHIELFAKNPEVIRLNPLARRMVNDFKIAQAALKNTPEQQAVLN